MKCYTIDGSGLDSLGATERPDLGEPGPGEVLVDVYAASLNYRDLLVADGRYSGPQDPPIIPCSDMAGVVAKVGEGVKEFRAGERVLNAPFRGWAGGPLRSEWARTGVGVAGVDGTLAEQILFPAATLARLPDHMSFSEGSTLTVAGLTAWAALATHGRIRAGEWALMHGTGGVSIFGAQIAKLLGARTIISTASKEKAEFVFEHFGVDAVIDYRDEAWPEHVRDVTDGAGAHVVVETAGGVTLAKSIEAAASGGRVNVIGVLDGAKTTLDIRRILMRQVTIRGIFMESAEELRALARALGAAEVHPHVDRVFPFDQAREAYDHLESQTHVGKVVVEVRSES